MARSSKSRHQKLKDESSHDREVNKRVLKVYIYEDEMEKIRDWVLLKDNIETGGDLFGLWEDQHTAIVQFVLGPGKQCHRTTTSFFQDVEYLAKADNYLTKEHGLCNIGQWHSHHRLSLSHPSGGDERTVWGNMPELGMTRYIVFIATLTPENDVNVNCFLFELDEDRRLPVLKGRFEMLKGSSPLRENTLTRNIMKDGAEQYPTPIPKPTPIPTPEEAPVEEESGLISSHGQRRSTCHCSRTKAIAAFTMVVVVGLIIFLIVCLS